MTFPNLGICRPSISAIEIALLLEVKGYLYDPNLPLSRAKAMGLERERRISEKGNLSGGPDN